MAMLLALVLALTSGLCVTASVAPATSQAAPAPRFATYPVDLRVTPTLAGVRLRLGIIHPRTGAVVRKFAIVHERPLHLFVISQGLEFFTHEHPLQQADGVFMLDVTLPRQGPYMAIAAFLPEGGTAQIFQQAFTTGEPFARDVKPPLDIAAKIVDGMRMSMDASQLSAGSTRPLTFIIEDAASGAAVTDLEPYLGASADLLLVPVDLTEAIHSHPAEAGTGPVVTLTPLVPRPGRYKAWVQIQRGGRVSTAAFVVDVPSK